LKTQKEIEKHLEEANAELERIEKEVPSGSAIWRMQKSYISALEWVLYGECGE